MTSKTVAERLRETAENYSSANGCLMLLHAATGDLNCPPEESCWDCRKGNLLAVADDIEAEQTELRKQGGVDVDALQKVADEMADLACVPNYKRSSSVDMNYVAKWWQQIANVLKGANPSKSTGLNASKLMSLPEGIEWPRFTDGELVKFGDEFVDHFGRTHKVRLIQFNDILHEEWFISDGTGKGNGDTGRKGKPFKRPEPEVLDADGMPIKVGDTVYWTRGGDAKTVKRIVDGFVEVEESIVRLYPEQLTHRKPDTFESVVAEMLTDFDSHDTIELDGYFDRLRKLMGGE